MSKTKPTLCYNARPLSSEQEDYQEAFDAWCKAENKRGKHSTLLYVDVTTALYIFLGGILAEIRAQKAKRFVRGFRKHMRSKFQLTKAEIKQLNRTPRRKKSKSTGALP